MKHICLMVILTASWGARADHKDCGSERRLTYANAGYYYPVFSKDGSKIIFVDGPSSTQNFSYSQVDINGQNFQKYGDSWVLSDKFFRQDPNVYLWNENYVVSSIHDSSKMNQSVLLVTDLKTGHQRIINIGEGSHRVPTITPDGKKIIFSYSKMQHPNRYDLVIVNIDGSNPEVLVSGQSNWLPSVSPDGKYVVYSKHPENRMSVGDIYVKCLF